VLKLIPHCTHSTEEFSVTALTTAIDRQSERVGARIRELRRSRALTLVQLADMTELSHSFLSQLERGRARPSMLSLGKIARALGSSPVELMEAAAEGADAPEQPSVVLVRATDGTSGPFGGGHARLLVHGKRRFYPMEFTANNLDPGEYFVHAEDEFIHVVAGTMIVELDGQGRHTLTTGDSFYYSGGTPHRWAAVDEAGYRLFVVKEKPEII
jgi:transcriptional regulator with XRE-family HTH domain